jgi:C4-dicarboxylate-specific signal transduction histidine kinase
VGQELEAGSPDFEEIRASVRTIRETTDRAASVVKAMRMLSRDSLRDPPAPVPVAGLLQELHLLCERRFGESGVRLELTDRTNGAAVLARHTEVAQVLLNLLNNALDAARGRPDPWVRLEVDATASTVTACCIDTGAGIAPEHRHRVLEPFFTTKPVGEGAGLGLSVSRALAVRNGGTLTLRNEPHTTFQLELPRAHPGGAT